MGVGQLWLFLPLYLPLSLTYLSLFLTQPLSVCPSPFPLSLSLSLSLSLKTVDLCVSAMTDREATLTEGHIQSVSLLSCRCHREYIESAGCRVYSLGVLRAHVLRKRERVGERERGREREAKDKLGCTGDPSGFLCMQMIQSSITRIYLIALVFIIIEGRGV